LLAKAFAPSIRVNAVAPGLISPNPDILPEEWERLVQRVPLRRQGEPEAIARAILFLIESDYITGQVLVVDGGYQLV
jgi:NAD(P)-dependent dehydrogenase (short-subunit alcohol dehydrogenase family)